MSAPLTFELKVDTPSVAIETEAQRAEVSPAATVEAIFEIDSPTSGVEIEQPQGGVSPSTDPTVIFAVTQGPQGEQGPPGEGVQIFGEEPVGACDGVNTTFTTQHGFRPGSTAVFLNGLREPYFIATPPNTIVFDEPPSSADYIAIDYIVAD